MQSLYVYSLSILLTFSIYLAKMDSNNERILINKYINVSNNDNVIKIITTIKNILNINIVESYIITVVIIN